MSADIAKYLKYANLQMAAEALYEFNPKLSSTTPATGAVASYVAIDPAALTSGNNRSSRFTPTQAQEFKDDWTVVEHISNTSTGFSGTLFRALRTDESRGINEGELVVSFRSTEFADDAARDNQATNAMEIKAEGWAFGQISDMQAWVESLYASGKITASDPLTVTGYSLGGHLATAFNLLYPGAIAATYTFNAAGVGLVQPGHSLTEVMKDFTSHRAPGSNADLFSERLDIDNYQRLRNIFVEGATVTVEQVKAEMVALMRTGIVPPESSPLYDALNRIRLVVDEAERINAGISSGGAGDAALPVAVERIAAIGLDYQLAVLRASERTASYRTDFVTGGVDAYGTRNLAPGGALPGFNDLYGANPPSAVSNSQVHYGTAIPIFIEDQPLARGNIVVGVGVETAKAFGEVKLLVDQFALNDFGDTHSLVLIVDSLSVQNALARLDPTLSQAAVQAIFAAASTKVSESAPGTQGKAEGDVLENVVIDLAAMLGVEIDPMAARLEGGTWADTKDRAVLHDNLLTIVNSDAFALAEGDMVVQASSASLRAAAREDFGAAVALLELSPFWITGKDADAKDLLEEVLASTHADAFAAWDRDRTSGTPTVFTDQWIADRAALLSAQMVQGRTNSTNELVYDVSVPSDRVYEFRQIAHDMSLETARPILFATSRQGSPLPDQRIVFGDDQGNVLEGSDNRLGDHLYGGASNDTLIGGDGNDHLQGAAGDDIYRFSGDWGTDMVVDSDGQGRIEVDGVVLSGGLKLGDNEWQSADEQWHYLQNSEGDLVINRYDAPGRIIVRGWAQSDASGGGKLGIELQDQEVPAGPVQDDVLVLQGDQFVAQDSPHDWKLLPDGRFSPADVWPDHDDVIHLAWGYEHSFKFSVFSETVGDKVIGETREFTSLHYRGLDGNDVITATMNDDDIDGGEGDDVIFGGLGSDLIVGGSGNDIIAANLSARYIPVRPQPLAPGASIWTSGARGYLDEHDEVAYDHHWHTEISQYGYLDMVNFHADTVENTRGALPADDPNQSDFVDAGEGDDWVFGGAGSDVIDGGSGADSLSGLSGDDMIDGGDGDDRLAGDFHGHALMVIATAQSSQIWYNGYPFITETEFAALRGDDVIDAGAGNDEAWGDAGDDLIWGGSGDDRLFGDAAIQAVAGAQHGSDLLEGGVGADILVGGGGEDMLIGGVGDDSLRGDAGDLSTEFQRDDYLDGGEGDDHLEGDGGNDTLLGGTGFDILFGDDGNDLLVSDGDDYLDGGAGDDVFDITLSRDSSRSSQIVDYQGTNTIRINAPAVDWAQVRVVSNGGLAFLVWGDEGMVSLGERFDPSLFEIADLSGERRSMASLINAPSGGGKLGSGFWDAVKGWTSTADVTEAQTLVASASSTRLTGGAGADLILGNVGDDLLEGGAGADVLVGGAGADVLRGGTGSDTLNAGRREEDGPDDAQDVYLFDRGDGADLIEARQGDAPPAAALDVIRFGAGIGLADIQIRSVEGSTPADGKAFLIEYGQGDSVTLAQGAELGIKELQFADGTAASLAELLTAPAEDDTPSPDGVIRPQLGDTLVAGTERNDHLSGNGSGSDLSLVGGPGSDTLSGGAGRNTYVFASGSGSDVVVPTAGESSVLRFDGDVRVRVQGDDLLLSVGGVSLVRLRGYGTDTTIGATWQIDTGGGKLVDLDRYVREHTLPRGTREERKLDFLDEQFWQMLTQAQLRSPIYNVGEVSADVVVEEHTQMTPGQSIFPSLFFGASDYEIVMSEVTRREAIYEDVNVVQGNAPRFTPQQAPSGGGLFGHSVRYIPPPPAPPEPPPASTERRIVGYETYTETVETYDWEWTAVQSNIKGTASADIVTPTYERLSIEWATEGSWRGMLETGEGNDVLTFPEKYYNQEIPLRLYDSTPFNWSLGGASHDFQSEIARGLGAWIDMGDGDDRATGTEAEDVIIGGAGSDWLDGAAGSDTYLIDTSGTDVDRISDMAKADGIPNLPSWAYDRDTSIAEFQAGADFSRASRDTVEFDSSITLGNLSYRWSEPFAADFAPRHSGDTGTSLRVLELYTGGRKFLEIEYEASPATYAHPVSLPGVEQFRFADGMQWSLDELLWALDKSPSIGPPLPPGADDGSNAGGGNVVLDTATPFILPSQFWQVEITANIETDVFAGQIEVVDGQGMLDGKVQSMVQAMAAFSPPSAGQTLPHTYGANTPDFALAADWR